MDIFTGLYLKTTNPNLTLSHFLNPKLQFRIVLSDIFHTTIYTLFCNLVSYIFFGKLLSKSINIRLVVSLLIIMFLGFFARFLHVKEIYKAYNYNLDKTRTHLDKLYISWIFIS